MSRKTRTHYIPVVLLACMLVLTLAKVNVAQPANAARLPDPPNEKLTLAFFYMWYGPDSFSLVQMVDAPVRPYISDHRDVVETQVRQAHSAGIDAFVMSWSGAGTDTDRNFPTLLDVAAQNGMRATLYIECNSAQQHGDLAAQVQAAAAKYAGHPAFLHYNGKPVLFFWSPQSLGGVDAWRALRQKVDPDFTQVWSVDTTDPAYLDVFDGVHLFSAGKWNASTNVGAVDSQWRGLVDNYNKVHGTQRIWAAGATPGWDESKIVPPRSPAKVIPRHDGATYTESWNSALASRPDWITITSWNEWFEGSQLEPAASYSNRYLDMTRRFVDSWKQGQNPCSGGTLFSETGHSVCAAMEPYWRQYGGMAQFGYPISEPATEQSSTDGKQYTVQYFERARFELHPENHGTPYEVQLSLLGRQFHAVDAAKQQAAGQHYFPQTGHNVSAGFYGYWLDHGGLFVNGYPISEECQEKLADGRVYAVQYFERSRFEWHPENPPSANVLLGLLGRLAMQSSGK